MKFKVITVLIAGLFLALSLESSAQKSNILIEKGLAYLAQTQSTSKDLEQRTGPSIDPLMVPEEAKVAGHWQSDAGITALCLQAFIANGHGYNDPLYGLVVQRAITFLLGNQITSGYHAGAFSWTTYGYGTAQAIVALKSAYNSAGLPEPLKTQVLDACNLAMNYYTQDVQVAWPQASWRYDRSYTSQTGGDGSVCQWVYLALNEMGYVDKDIWNKNYNYINNRKCTSGNRAWVGYQSCWDWSRGNTGAGLWGLVLAKQHGVAAADGLIPLFYNYLEQYTLAQLFTPGDISNHVYSGGGYYYYVYEIAKALSLGNKTNFAGGEWYTYLYNVIESQHGTNAQGNYYWDGWGGQGAPFETALALLCLQTGTVPEGSTLTISLDTDLSGKNDCVDFTIFDELGNAAGRTGGIWYTNIPNSEWISTAPDFWELQVELQESTNFNVEIVNNCLVVVPMELCFKAYILDVLVDEECFLIDANPYTTIGATAFVNAIGGLNVIVVNPPAVIPVMVLSPAAIGYNPFQYSQTYNFTFDVTETTGESPLLDIDIFASVLTDQFGHTIPATAFTFVPNNIAAIPPGGTVTVQGTFVTPASLPAPDPGLFQGVITAQTTEQAKAINFEIGKPTMNVAPAVINVTDFAGNANFTIDFTGFIGAAWSIGITEPWLTCVPMNGTGDATVTINYDANLAPVTRSAVITVTAPDAFNTEATVTLNQDEGSFVEGDQLIQLQAGWLGISSYIIPDVPGIEEVLAGIEDEMIIIFKSGGGFYWPSQNINLLGDWDSFKGYKIKMAEPAILGMNGVFISPQAVTLPAGTHYLPVLSENGAGIEMLEALGNAVLFATNIQEGLVYWPGGGIYTLTSLEPGIGYLISLTAEATFDYSGKSAPASTPVAAFVNNTPWNDVTRTGDAHIISVNTSAMTDLEPGDVVGVFNASGLCVGMTRITNLKENAALIVYGDDMTTSETDGLGANENMIFKVYRPATDQSAELTATFDPTFNTSMFEAEGLSMILNFKFGPLGLNGITKTTFDIYPNPSNGMFNITTNGTMTIQVINVQGQAVNTSKVEGNTTLDLSPLGQGVYYIHATSVDGVQVRKIVIQ